jgi:hypothetical protein
MDHLGLTPEEFRHIVMVCQRVLINPFTASLDLKCFLVTRLNEAHPDTAARIESFDERQMEELRHGVVSAVQADSDSPLWP